MIRLGGVHYACSKAAGVPASCLYLVAQGNPVGQVAKDLGISESCLRRWMSIDDVDAGRKEGLTSAERKELVELRRRNRVLEMELEILKRASAYFARENVLPKQ